MSHTLVCRVVLVALLSVGSVSLSPVHADPLPGQEEERRLLSDRLNVTLGGYRPDFSTDLAAGFGGVLGVFINVERSLGVDEDLGVFFTTGHYRYKPRHAIEWYYTVLNREGTTLIDEEITFGDPPQQFELGAEISTKFNSTLFAVNYRYSFINNGKIDAGISAGLFTYSYDIELVGRAFIIGDPGSAQDGQDASARVLAPLPAFGIFMDYAFRKNVVFRGSVRALSLEFQDFRGRYVDTRFSLEWYFYKHLGIGIGGAGTAIDFRDKDPDDPFNVNYEYTGYLAYLSIVF